MSSRPVKKPAARPAGKTRDVRFQIGARKMIPMDHKTAWHALTSREGARLWLGDIPGFTFARGADFHLANGTAGVIRVYKAESHLRLTWQPPGWERPSVIQVRVLPRGDRTVIAFHQEHLPGPVERDARAKRFNTALEGLTRMAARA